jgi:hypothetical protein
MRRRGLKQRTQRAATAQPHQGAHVPLVADDRDHKARPPHELRLRVQQKERQA